jgi:hypothetical protein
MTETGHSSADVHQVDEEFFVSFLDRVGIDPETLNTQTKDRLADLLGELLAAEQSADSADDDPRPAGQKTTTMTDDEPTLDDLAEQHGAALREEALAAELTDATDDLGHKKGRTHDPANHRSDDLGQRHADPDLDHDEVLDAISGSLRQKLTDEPVVFADAGQKTTTDGDDSDVDELIEEAASGEGW